jgi:MmyB-like transcription regulator ligand binding domain/Helix-turn-helix domain
LAPILGQAAGIVVVRLVLGLPDPPLRAGDTEGMAADSRQELAEFLKTRRTRIRPEDLGLEPGPRRRVAGLRREELALLAGVSTDYYQRMEQGRSTEFTRLWARHDVEETTRGQMRVNHPLVGELSLDWDAYPMPGAPGPVLIVYTAPRDGPDAERLSRLAGLLGEPDPAPVPARSD